MFRKEAKGTQEKASEIEKNNKPDIHHQLISVEFIQEELVGTDVGSQTQRINSLPILINPSSEKSTQKFLQKRQQHDYGMFRLPSFVNPDDAGKLRPVFTQKPG